MTDFEKQVIIPSREKPVLLIFSQEQTCHPCRMLKPVLEELEKNREDVSFYRVTDINIYRKYQVQSVPTLILISVGQPLSVVRGFQPKVQLEKWLDNFKEPEWKEA